MATAVPVILSTRTGTPQYWRGQRATRQSNDVLSPHYNGVDFSLAGGTGDSAAVPDPALVTGTVGSLIEPGVYNGTVDYPDTEDFRGLAVGNSFVGPIDGGFSYFINTMVAPEIAYLRISRTGKVFTFTLTTWSFINTGFYTAPYPAPTFYADFGGSVTNVTGTAIGDAHYAVFTHDFTTPATPIRFEVVDGYGQRSRWYELRLGPVCEYSVDETALPVIGFDGSASFDPDGTVTTWEWQVSSDEAAATGETATYDASDYEGQSILVNLKVTDNDGLISRCEPRYVTIDDRPRMDSAFDAAGHLLVARNDGLNVIVEAFPGGLSTRQLRSTIVNAKNPSIWRDKSNILHLLYTDRASGQAWTARSHNSGRSFA